MVLLTVRYEATPPLIRNVNVAVCIGKYIRKLQFGTIVMR